MRRLPPLGSIQAFVEVARLGSLKAAADVLALSPPALTRRIQSLEQFVSAALFDRQRNTVLLNSRGKAFLAEIEPHLEALAVAVERATDDPRAMRIRIAVPSLFAAQRLLPALPELRRQHPDLIIDLDTGAERLSRLGDGVDAAIAVASEIQSGHYARMLERGRIIAIGARGMAGGRDVLNDPDDLRALPVLLHRQMPSAFDKWRRSVGHPDLEPAQVSYFDAGQLILDAAAEGLGVAFMLDSHLACSTDGRLAQVFMESVESPYAYWFVCPAGGLERRGVGLFHDWLLDTFSPASSFEQARAIGAGSRS